MADQARKDISQIFRCLTVNIIYMNTLYAYVFSFQEMNKKQWNDDYVHMYLSFI